MAEPIYSYDFEVIAIHIGHILVNFPSYKNYILNWDFDSKIKIFHLFVLWRNTTKNFYYAEKYLFLFLMEEIIRYTYYFQMRFCT